MSKTYSIVCLDCKRSLWIAQGWDDPKTWTLYSRNNKIMAELQNFLFKHVGHNLTFLDDEKLCYMEGIEEIEYSG